MTIKLTNNEWDIIDHRLCCTDELAEVYADTMYCNSEDAGKKISDEERNALFAAAHAEADRLHDQISESRVINVAALSEVGRFIIADCIDGSTFFCGIDDAVWDGELTKGKSLALRKAGHAITKKLNEAGIECQMIWD
jgi:hypothetical protein